MGKALKEKKTALFFVAYTCVVHLINYLGKEDLDWLGIEWGSLQISIWGEFDFTDLLIWMVIPFVLVFRKIDWSYFGFSRWEQRDIGLLLAIMAAGWFSMQMIPLFPSLSQYYEIPPSPAEKRELVLHSIVWTLSWLPGWEFLHRYVLLTRLEKAWKNRGWMLIPMIETVYHFQKPMPEAFGMMVLSIVLTCWARKRRNVLLPFCAHGVVEMDLLLFRVI